MKYIFVDFDGTLAKSPEPTDMIAGQHAIDYAKIHFGNWSGKGWWGRPESLMFDIEPNAEIVEAIKVAKANGYKVCLLTARLPKLKDRIVQLCNSFFPNWDGFYFKDGNKDKLSQMQEIVDFGTAERIVFIDDREKEIVPALELEKKFSNFQVIDAKTIIGGK